MEVQKARVFEDRKFMWDGKVYETEKEALENKNLYEKENFETRLVNNEGKFLLYTRRVVTEVVVEGAPLV